MREIGALGEKLIPRWLRSQKADPVQRTREKERPDPVDRVAEFSQAPEVKAVETPAPSPVVSKAVAPASPAILTERAPVHRSDYEQLVDSWCGQKMPPEIRADLVDGLSGYDLEQLRDLQQKGYTLRVQRTDPHLGGGFSPETRAITLNIGGEMSSKERRWYTRHEVFHALDFATGRGKMTTSQALLNTARGSYDSGRDPEIAELYHNHVARSWVDLALHLKKESQDKPGPIQVGDRRFKVESRSAQGREEIVVTEVNRAEAYLKAGNTAAIGAITMGVLAPLAGILGVAAAGLTGGLAALPFAGAALRYGKAAFEGLRNEARFSRLDHRFDLPDGGSAQVRSNGKTTVIKIPEGARGGLINTGYAAISREPHEYTAEGMARWMEEPAVLEARDPGLADWLQRRGYHRGN